MSSKKWIIIYMIFMFALMIICPCVVIRIDPWMHFHKPLIDTYAYRMGIDEERLINFGIAKNFDYDAMITGTSMTENFSATECDEIFKVKTIKVPFAGGKYNRINDVIKVGLKYHPDMKVIVRGLDTNGILFSEQDNTEDDLTYPLYLINDNPFDDVNYILNKEVLLNYCTEMVLGRLEGNAPGVLSFDDYARWNDDYTYGKDVVLSGRDHFSNPFGEDELLSDEDVDIIAGNIEKNVIEVAREYPNTEFFYFYPPYSVVYWGNLYENARLKKQVNLERMATRMILDSECENIHLYGFADRMDITENLDNYKDAGHYGDHVNSRILIDMNDGIGLLTKSNYNKYYDILLDIYENYDYNSLFN